MRRVAERMGMSTKMFWIIIVLLVVLFGGALFGFIVLDAGKDLPFCQWWDHFMQGVLGEVPILREVAGFGCPFPD